MSDSTVAGARATPLNLRVLSGRQSQVEAPIEDGRYLIGNDEADCDLVIDLGVSDRQVVILRAEGTMLNVIVLAGDAWVGDRHLGPQQSSTLRLGEVLTVGRVSMAIAAQGFAFETLRLPDALRKKGDRPELAAVAMPPRSNRALRAATVFRTAVIAAFAISAGGALVWGSGLVSASRDPTVSGSPADNAELQSRIRAMGFSDVRVIADGTAGQSVVEGFVPDAAAYTQLEQALSRLPRVPALRVHPVQPVSDALALRLSQLDPALQMKYVADGTFEIATPSERFLPLRDTLERALKDLPGIKAIRIAFTDMVVPGSTQKAKVTIARSATRLGELVITGDKVPIPGLGAEPSTFVEIRWGELPSAVTRQGERLFAGARMPDGSVISRIEPDAVILAKGGAERAEFLDAASTPGLPRALDAVPPPTAGVMPR
jgi:hypothetical protein